MKTYEATIYPSIEGNMKETALLSINEEDCMTNSEKCDYISHSIILNRLHKLSLHVPWLQLFQLF